MFNKLLRDISSSSRDPKMQLLLASRRYSTSQGNAPGGNGGNSDHKSSSSNEAPNDRSSESPSNITPPTTKQLWQLFLLSAVPFIGFGFADNFIMIVAGDAIDNSIGLRMGLSTLAAAGIGNLISDVCGIGLGEFVESWSASLGLKDPRLTPEQAALRKSRWVKSLACILGISIGCILGMIPLLFLDNNKLYFFNKEEEELYEDLFLKNNVPPMAFFSLIRKGTWRQADPGETIVEENKNFEKVLLLRSGVAVAYLEGKELYAYLGQSLDPSEEHLPHRVLRGCVIGGTALVDQNVTKTEYKNKVVAEEKVTYLEWTLADLRAAMDEDKHIRAALFSILYKDLVKGLRNEKKRRKSGTPIAYSPKRQEYFSILEAVLADGLVHPAERALVDQFRKKHQISSNVHFMCLHSLGWTEEEYNEGFKEISRMDLASNSTEVLTEVTTEVSTVISSENTNPEGDAKLN